MNFVCFLAILCSIKHATTRQMHVPSQCSDIGSADECNGAAIGDGGCECVWREANETPMPSVMSTQTNIIDTSIEATQMTGVDNRFTTLNTVETVSSVFAPSTVSFVPTAMPTATTASTETGQVTQPPSPVTQSPTAAATQPSSPSSVPCLLSSWSMWSNCVNFCSGDGTRVRERDVAQAATGGGSCPAANSPERRQVDACGQGCQSCLWAPWSSWSACSATCGSGSRMRSRTTAVDASCGCPCVGTFTQTAACSAVACPTIAPSTPQPPTPPASTPQPSVPAPTPQPSVPAPTPLPTPQPTPKPTPQPPPQPTPMPTASPQPSPSPDAPTPGGMPDGRPPVNEMRKRIAAGECVCRDENNKLTVAPLTTPLAAIIGGVVGAIMLIVVCVVALFCIVRKRRANASDSQTEMVSAHSTRENSAVHADPIIAGYVSSSAVHQPAHYQPMQMPKDPHYASMDMQSGHYNQMPMKH